MVKVYIRAWYEFVGGELVVTHKVAGAHRDEPPCVIDVQDTEEETIRHAILDLDDHAWTLRAGRGTMSERHVEHVPWPSELRNKRSVVVEYSAHLDNHSHTTSHITLPQRFVSCAWCGDGSCHHLWEQVEQPRDAHHYEWTCPGCGTRKVKRLDGWDIDDGPQNCDPMVWFESA